MTNRRSQTFMCPHCGTDVPTGASACPECGSDEETGWSDQTIYDGLDLPEPHNAPREWEAKKDMFWWAVAVLVLITIVSLVLSGIW